jgi:dihydrofolate synthase/folylpolyglutamate synthase
MSQNSKAIFDYIFGLTTPGVKLELSRVKQFMSLLGNPYQAYDVIHIAGTNGKGSTAAMMAAILNTSGIKTGLFTSPHLLKPNERIRIGQVMIPDEFIITKVESWKSHIDELGITFFEVLAALGMVYFKEQGVKYAVFETGLGGRLDATNVVDPIISIITSISMDHENILGDTLEKIALEKAGIIKKNKPLILAKNTPDVIQLMKTRCEQKQSEFVYVPELTQIENVVYERTSQEITIRINEQSLRFNLPLLGKHQAENFCNVLAALDQIGFVLDPIKIQKGLDALQWLGRIQALQENPLILYDVAHNSAGLESLMDSLRMTKMEDCILIAAFNARKNVSTMLELLETWSGPILYTAFKGHSALDADALRKLGINPKQVLDDPEQAYASALEIQTDLNQSICFFGSHYLAESLFELFNFDT